MSLYNMLFGVNSLAPLLKAILKLDCEGGTSTGRFRDIYFEDDETICLYTRNGGNNRDCWESFGCEDESKAEKADSEYCGCPGCVQTYVLPKHPNYLRDEDDDFDNTYAYTYFSVPTEHQDIVSAIHAKENPEVILELIKSRFPHIVKPEASK